MRTVERGEEGNFLMMGIVDCLLQGDQKKHSFITVRHSKLILLLMCECEGVLSFVVYGPDM
jgi:hypothetical protein